MKARKKLLGQEHEDTLWSMSLVGDAYNLRGKWDAGPDVSGYEVSASHPLNG